MGYALNELLSSIPIAQFVLEELHHSCRGTHLSRLLAPSLNKGIDLAFHLFEKINAASVIYNRALTKPP